MRWSLMNDERFIYRSCVQPDVQPDAIGNHADAHAIVRGWQYSQIEAKQLLHKQKALISDVQRGGALTVKASRALARLSPSAVPPLSAQAGALLLGPAASCARSGWGLVTGGSPADRALVGGSVTPAAIRCH